jgi:preprotein translocase subunit SecY
MAGSAILNIFRIKDLRERVLFTLGILVVYRLGSQIPIPGINVNALKIYYLAQSSAATSIVDYLDLFAGGAFKNFSVFMLGIMPAISMSIIMQVMMVVFPRLKKISEEEGGRKKIQRYTRYGTVLVALVQAFTATQLANTIPEAIVLGRTAFVFIAMLAVTTGTMMVMWLGEQITQRGIGNGSSMIIFAGIVARLPQSLVEMVGLIRTRELNPVYVIVVLAMFVVVVALVIYEQQGQRKIPVHYAKRVIGRRIYGSQNTYIPFKINPSGVIPVIFASSLLIFPIQIAGNLGGKIEWLGKVATFLSPRGVAYEVIYALLIIFFAYFYTQVTLNPTEVSKNIRENGGSIPGIRSEKMEEYLTRILNRIILPGALFLTLIAIIPTIIQNVFRFPQSLALLMGGTSLLIMVGVDLDTMSQIEGHLRMHHHEGFVKKGRLRSRNL